MKKTKLDRNIFVKDFRLMLHEHFDPDEAERIWNRADLLNGKYASEHPDAYSDVKLVAYPIGGIYTALHEVIPKEEALNMMLDYAPVIGEKLRGLFLKLTAIPGVPALVWRNMGKIINFAGSEKKGYKSKVYGVKGNEAALDILSCPVVNALAELGMPEAAPVMCAMDRIYSNGYRGIQFRRTKSVAEGDDCCDYRYKYVMGRKRRWIS